MYTSDETSASEVYVRPFTPPGVSEATSAGGKTIVSTHGGTFPRWKADGREILYQSRDGKMMAVDVTTSPALRLGPPHPLFDLPIGVTRWGDLSADGTRFLVPVPIEESGQASINLVLNWQSGLKK